MQQLETYIVPVSLDDKYNKHDFFYLSIDGDNNEIVRDSDGFFLAYASWEMALDAITLDSMLKLPSYAQDERFILNITDAYNTLSGRRKIGNMHLLDVLNFLDDVEITMLGVDAEERSELLRELRIYIFENNSPKGFFKNKWAKYDAMFEFVSLCNMLFLNTKKII